MNPDPAAHRGGRVAALPALVLHLAVGCAVLVAAPQAAGAPNASSATVLPSAVARIVRDSGLPSRSFGLSVRAVDGGDAPPLVALNAGQSFLLASTTKLVTSLAALDLLGAGHRWSTTAYATGPLADGRLAGDLVIVGGPVGLTGNELRRWFRQMHGEGLDRIGGNIALEDVALLHDREPTQVKATELERAPAGPPDAKTYNDGKLLVSIRAARGAKAIVSVTPRPVNVLVVNDVFMGGGCSAWARWRSPDEIQSGPPLQLWVRGRWSNDCGRDDIAYVSPVAGMRMSPELGAAPAVPLAAPRMVSDLWGESGGALRGRVVERDTASRRRASAWSSELSTPLPEVLREMNKTSNNAAAGSVLRALAEPASDGPRSGGRAAAEALKSAQSRVRGWLRGQGLADGDINVVEGSGVSRAERGKPQALVELLRAAWRSADAQVFVDSLPIAGVDGTLVHRLRGGAAEGSAFLKTGTLSDTRALAGYVRAKSGKVYAVTAIVTDPEAALGVRALDALIEWVASKG